MCGNFIILKSNLYVFIIPNPTLTSGSDKLYFSVLNKASNVVIIIQMAPQKYKYPKIQELQIKLIEKWYK